MSEGGRRLRRLLGLGAIVGLFAVLRRGSGGRASSALRRVDQQVEGFTGRGARLYGLVASPLLSPLHGRVAAEVEREVRVRGREASACIADLGCGPGDLAARVSAALPGCEVIGIDLSDEMVGIARERHTGANGRLRFLFGDVAALPFDAGSLDVVVSTLSLHHWADPARALGEVRRVLRPGGVALLYDLRPLGSSAHISAIAAEAGLAPGDIRSEPLGAWPPAMLFVRIRIEASAPPAIAV